MHVLVAGATGFVGRALVLRLRREGHTITAWVRRPAAARALLGDEVELLPMQPPGRPDPALVAAVEAAGAIVNLAGEPIAPGRWTEARKARLVSSRVGTTQALVDAIGRAQQRPEVLVSASAIGIYGARQARPATEATPPGDDFLARLCQAWEAAARLAEPLGVRVVLPRIGVVLGLEGGILGSVLPAFDAGLALGAGDTAAWLSWIHLHDLVALLLRAITTPAVAGPFNAVAPEPVRLGTFWPAVARHTGRRYRGSAPSWLVATALGEAGRALTQSVWASPPEGAAAPTAWAFPALDGALKDLLAVDAGLSVLALGTTEVRPLLATEHPYLKARRPTYLLRAESRLAASLPDVFAFFCRAENLGLMTPRGMAMRIEGKVPAAMHVDLRIRYGLRMGPVPMHWQTQITHWEPPYAFVDAQERGPYRAWWHEHHFRAVASGTEMEDRVFYAPPLGPLGRAAHAISIRRQLERIFLFRKSAISLRFGPSPAPLNAHAAG